MARGLRELIAEANRRRVFRTAGVYLVAVWGVSQGAAEMAPLFGAPDWVVRAIVIGSIAFLPVVVVLAWMFELGREGIVRDPEDVPARHADQPDIADMPTIAFGKEDEGALIVRWEDSAGAHARLFQEEVFLGRGSDCVVRFYDPLVSRRHARLHYEHDGWHLEDLGSRNGTLVNDRPANDSPLVGESLVRVNESGPILRVEVVEPGVDARLDASGLPIERGIAHLRAIR
jgi:pSer/pThr/pTyr-binding forkhead associated (FHA) protein